eukprot:s3872_g3.t1
MLVFIQHVESCHYAVVAFLLETLEAPWQIWQCRACGTRPFVAASSRWLCQIRIWSGLDTGQWAAALVVQLAPIRLTGRTKLGAARQTCQKGTSGRILETTAQHTSPTLWQIRVVCSQIEVRPKPTIRNGWTASDERPGRARSSDPRSGGYTLGIVLRDGQLDENRIPDTILQLMSKKAPKDKRKVARHASASPPRRQSSMPEVCKAAAQGGPARETSAFIYPGKMQEDESSRSTLAP